MDFAQTLTPIGSSFALIVVIGTIIVAIFYGRAKAKTANADGIANAKDIAMSDMQKSLDLVRQQNTDQAAQMTSLESKVTGLTGEVNTLKDVPLAKIEAHMADTAVHMATTNRLIEMLIPLIPQSISVDTLTKTTKVNR
ncbi:hypothetical protein E3O44_12720 [Cryobacterium algoricola]|uniref:DUF2746 domain-containing protein n=1 Tax=Cryobacterium algoricola TaxID=1259183 RepID=A0ABY2ICJ0_9MICO|nr:hypothetical protein [Cryobacterium algoricola]TFB85859.1 hypothetical protein E3O44_12720 [Cryobacterium algoricola]